MTVRVLLVDDEPDILELTRLFLERTGGFDAEVSTSVREALVKLKSRRFDAIVSDYMMPETDGLEFLKRLRASGDDTPFIIFTGRGREDVAIEALNSGADFYLQKGGDPKAQFAELANMLRQATARRKAMLLVGSQKLEARALFQAFMDSAPFLAFVKDASGRHVYVNKAFETTFGIGRSDWLGKTSEELFPAEIARAHAINDREVLDRQVPLKYLEEATLKGATHDFLTYKFPVADADGKLTMIGGIAVDITERKEAENALREAYRKLEKLELIVGKSPAVAFLWRVAEGWPVEFVSESVKQWGYTPEDFLTGRVVYGSMIHPDDLERVEREVESNSRAGMREFAQEYRILTKSGEERWVYDLTYRLTNPEGEVTHHQGIVVDVTDKHRAEERLRLLSTAVEQSASSIVITNEKGEIEYVNPKYSQISGYPVAELLGQNPRILKSGKTPPEEYKRLWDTITRGMEWHGEFLNKKKSGELYWESATIAPVADPYSRKVHYVGVKEDITFKKMAEEELRESRASLAEAQRIAHLGNIVVSTQPFSIKWSEEAVRILGLDQGKPPKSFSELADLVFEEDKELLVSRMSAAMRSRERLDIEFRIRRPSGDVAWVYVKTRPVGDQGPASAGRFFATVMDITDRKRIEESLRQANEKLGLLGQVTRHDMMNQLSVLEGWLDIARAAEKDKAVLEYLTSMSTAAETIKRQIEFMADYQEMGVRPPEWIPLEEACSEGTSGLALGKVSLTVDLGGYEVYADRMIEKVFRNLVDNALRHGGKALSRIVIRAQLIDDGLAVVCEDDGEGVPETDKERIFEHGYGRHTGLGLYVTRQILGITGMTIRETGRFGEGARFEISVPKGSFRQGGR